jgi:site-specific recombinase XerD
MRTREELKERIIELNYETLQCLDKQDKVKILMIRKEMTKLIEEYLNGNKNGEEDTL